MKKILLLDGNSILNRAFYGISNLSTTDGFPTNAIYGFLAILFKEMNEESPDYLAVAFDLHEPTFRHKMYSEYKGTRHKMPEELVVQVPRMKTVLKSMGIPIFEQAGFEADDLIGTLSKKAQADGLESVIISADRDLLQLVDEHIFVKLTKPIRGGSSSEKYGIKEVLEKYSILPIQIIELKALMGDSSDNIPGLPGVGEKTATSIIKEFGNISNALEHVEELKPNKAKIAFKEHFELAVLSKKLATIDLNAPACADYEKCKCEGYFNQQAYNEFKDLDFKNFLNKFEVSDNTNIDLKKENDFTINTFNSTRELMAAVGNIRTVGIHVFKNDYKYDCSIYYDTCVGILLNINYDDMKYILEQLLNLSSAISTFSIDEIYTFTEEKNISKLFSTVIAAYLLNPIKTTYEYEDIARDYLGEILQSKSELFEKGNVKFEEINKYKKLLANYAYVAGRSYQKLNDELNLASMKELYYNIELPLSYSLFEMKKNGILVKPDELKEYGNHLGERIIALEQEIYDLAGEKFNINSPKQLGELLFGKLNLPYAKKTKSGYSTSADVLDKLKDEYEIVEKVLEYRQLSKFKSTYAEPLIGFIGGDGRIHSDFLQTVTATGRISSANPNLQNIPVKSSLGRMIRKVFVPRDGCKFIDADYSQIELRVLAHMSNDENLIRAYKDNNDIHQATASKVFNVDYDDVTKEQRQNAKAVNFGIIYGISAFGLSNDLKISQKTAKGYIEQYFSMYPKIKEFLDSLVDMAKDTGYSYTMFNRRRPVPELKSSNFMQRSFGERIAMNSPIQGTAADIIKLAMNAVAKQLRENGYKSKIVLQVHDELLIEAPINEVESVSKLLKEKMESICNLSVPLIAEVTIGDSWYETK